MITRKTLTLSQPLTNKTLVKLKLKRTPEWIRRQIEQDKKNKQQRIKNAVNWLCQRYPDCFNLQNLKPLKIGIEDEVLKARDAMIDQKEIPSKKSLRDAIKYYTQGINLI